MSGKFEKPRQRFTPEPQQPAAPQQAPGGYPGYSAPQQNSGNPGYGPGYDSYLNGGNPGGYPGDLMNGGYADDPMNGGYADDPMSGYAGGPMNGGYPGGPMGGGYPGDPMGSGQPPRKRKSSVLWLVLGILFPLVGLILYLAFKKTRPADSKASGKGALIGVIVGVVLALILAAVAFFGGKAVMNSYLDKMNKVDVQVEYTEDPNAPTETEYIVQAETTAPPTTEPPHIPSSDDYINFLIVGQSGREGEESRLADTMILVTLNTYEKKITTTSLLRDAFVVPPSPWNGRTFGRIKLTTVYHLGYLYGGNDIAGSMELIDLTLFKNFGIEVDHNFEVDFVMFENVVDDLGGVDIELDENEAIYMTYVVTKHKEEEHNFEPGMAHLDGMEALIYARMRHAYGDGDSDIKRTGRQQKMMAALLGKVKAMSVSDINKLAQSILPDISTSMSNQEIMDMLKLVIPMLKDLTIESGGTCPANYNGDLVDIYGDGMQHSVLRFNEGETKAHMRELTLGEKPAN